MKDDGRFVNFLYGRCLASSMLAILGSVIGQIFTAVLIGRALGADELSVVGVTLPVYYAYSTAGALIGVGGAAACARYIGSGRSEDSCRVFTAAYILTLVVSGLISCFVLLFSDSIVAALGVGRDMDIYDDALAYLRTLAVGGVFVTSIYPAFNLLRLDGRNLAVIAVFAVMAFVNIVVVVLLLFVFDAGVAGAAAATVVGAGAAGIFGAALLFFGSKNFTFTASGLKDSFWRFSREIILAGSPSALENLCVLTRTVVLNWVIVWVLSDIGTLSALKITDSVNSLALVLIAGASGAIMPFVGVFGVEQDTKSVRQLLALSFRWGGSMTLLFTAVCLFFPGQIAGLFGMGNTAEAVRLFAISLPLSLVNNILVCLYQANNKALPANIITVGRSLLWVILPALVLAPRFGAAGIWHGFWIGELAALALAFLTSVVYMKKNKFLSPLFMLYTEAEANGTYQSFSVKNTLDAIAESAEGIVGFCETNGLSSKKTMAISLSIEEMLVFIHEQCSPDEIGEAISVRVLILEDTVTLRIRNAGKPFNPIEYYSRMNENKDTDTIMQGLGMKMILDLAKKVHYSATFGVNNITILL